MIHLDTHVVVWLYAGQLDLLPKGVREQIEAEELRISPMVVLELEYLYEIGRTTSPALEVVADLAERIGLQISNTPFPAVTNAALSIKWTRDPFDRLIVAQASVEGVPLVTRDHTIRDHFPGASWS